MQRNIKIAAITLGLALAGSASIKADPLAKETFTLPEDRLAVTVASAHLDQKHPLDSELSIWVGEVELDGRKTVWVELIDTYGEVIYDSEVRTNETHLLPDGRAVVVNALVPDTVIAGKNSARLASEGKLTVTRRVVDVGPNAAAVELIQTEDEPVHKGTMLQIADFGQMVRSKISGVLEAASAQVKMAWDWIVDTLHA